jgi:hypothetical protein
MITWRDRYIGVDRIKIISNIIVDKASGAIAIMHCVLFFFLLKKNEFYGEKKERRSISKHDEKFFM